ALPRLLFSGNGRASCEKSRCRIIPGEKERRLPVFRSGSPPLAAVSQRERRRRIASFAPACCAHMCVEYERQAGHRVSHSNTGLCALVCVARPRALHARVRTNDTGLKTGRLLFSAIIG